MIPFLIKENELDCDTYERLRKAVGWNVLGRKQNEAAIANSFYSVVVHCNDIAVGMGRVVGDGTYFMIVDVVVDPEFQGNGIGASIIEKILEYIETNLPKGGRASIQLISEVGKEGFYLKEGFKLIPHEFCGPALRKVMHKSNDWRIHQYK